MVARSLVAAVAFATKRYRGGLLAVVLHVASLIALVERPTPALTAALFVRLTTRALLLPHPALLPAALLDLAIAALGRPALACTVRITSFVLEPVPIAPVAPIPLPVIEPVPWSTIAIAPAKARFIRKTGPAECGTTEFGTSKAGSAKTFGAPD